MKDERIGIRVTEEQKKLILEDCKALEEALGGGIKVSIGGLLLHAWLKWRATQQK